MRRKLLLLASLAALLPATTAHAAVRPGFELGWVRSSASYKAPLWNWRAPNAQNSFAGGVFLFVEGRGRIAASLGARLVERAHRVRFTPYSPGAYSTSEGTFFIRERYVTVPLTIRIRAAKRAFVSLGPELGLLQSANESRDVTNCLGGSCERVQTDEEIEEDLKGTEWSAHLGGGLDLPFLRHSLSVEVRYVLGISGVGDMRLYGPWESDWKNRSLETALGMRW